MKKRRHEALHQEAERALQFALGGEWDKALYVLKMHHDLRTLWSRPRKG